MQINEMIETANVAAEASQAASVGMHVTAASAVGNGIEVAGQWVKDNPALGLGATAAVAVGLGYLTYKAFSSKGE